jgi:hypothetical protein
MLFNFLKLWINSYIYYFLNSLNLHLIGIYTDLYIYVFGNYFTNFVICKTISLINNLINDTNEIKYYGCNDIIIVYIKNYLLLFSNLNIFPYEFYKYYLQNPNELNQLLLEWI